MEATCLKLPPLETYQPVVRLTLSRLQQKYNIKIKKKMQMQVYQENRDSRMNISVLDKK